MALREVSGFIGGRVMVDKEKSIYFHFKTNRLQCKLEGDSLKGRYFYATCL